MMFGRRVRHLGPIETLTTTTAETAATTTTTPTTSALINESRQLLLKQQLKLQLNINVSEMMDNLRRSMPNDDNNDVDNDDDNLYKFTQKFDGDLRENTLRVRESNKEQELGDASKSHSDLEMAAKDGQNKLDDTVTTVPQLQQKFNKFNIIEEAAATTSSSQRIAHVIATTTTTTTTSSSSKSSATCYTSLTQKHSENTALAKFNRIIDNTVPVIQHYQQQPHHQQQQHVADTLSKTSQPLPMLSDSLKRRLASHHPYYQTDLIVNNNSKIISSFDRLRNGAAAAATTTATTASDHPMHVQLPLISSQHQQPLNKRDIIDVDGREMEEVIVDGSSRSVVGEDDQLKRNDVHYLLKQLNSFSDIEEIEIVDMKQKQQRLQQQLIIRETQKQQQHEQQHEPQHQHQQQHPQHQHYYQQQQMSQQFVEDQKNLRKITESAIFSYDSQQQIAPQGTIETHVTHQAKHDSIAQVTTTTLPMYVSSYSQHISGINTTESLGQFVHLPPPMYADSVPQHSQQKADNDNDDDDDDRDNDADGGASACASAKEESKQHFQTSPHAAAASSSPTATSLVIYSPSSQSHKGIRRYASLHQQDDAQHHHYHMEHQMHSHCRYHTHHHSQHRHHPDAPPHYAHHHSHMPHEHYSEGSILDSAAARAAACDPLALQQFVDDYIFQSCHYLETNNFAANYCTAMVESSSHEFRPSTTTTTRTSNEEYDDEECYVEDHSSAHSFELHECEPPTVICKAPAPAPVSIQDQQAPQHIRSSMRHLAPLSSPPPQYTMETRLCSSGVQTDLTASSLAQSFSLGSSSSTSSTDQRKRRQPIFKCCYTPLDRWREKRHNKQQQHQQQHEEQQQQQQQQEQIQLQLTKKRTKTVTTTQREQQSNFSYSASASDPSHSPFRTTTTTTSCLKNTTVAVVGASANVNIVNPLDGGGDACAVGGGGGGGGGVAAAFGGTSASLVIHSQHHSLSTKNAPYAV